MSRFHLVVAAALCLFPAVAPGQPQATCIVRDAELQGKYSGGCRDGLAEGYGEASGVAQYRGEFRAGHKHGNGVKTWPSGDRYEGAFVADRKNGVGTYTWGPHSAWPGERYSGEWRNDLRHGTGTYEWPGGDRYVGPWEYGVITGPATPAMMARARAYAERVAAVGKSGIRVCREFTVGLVTQDRVRGTVMAVVEDRLAVRIDDTGRFQHAVGDVVITKGMTLHDPAWLWVPCL